MRIGIISHQNLLYSLISWIHLEKSQVPLSVTHQHFSSLHIRSASQVLMIHETLLHPHWTLCIMVTTKPLSRALLSFAMQALYGFKIPLSAFTLENSQR
jgi:hypothetical protein